jgi:hypothetical protein
MNYTILTAELTGDPLVRGYSGMDDAAAAADLNTAYREQNRTSMTGSEVLNAIDETEYFALADGGKDRVWQLLHLGTLDPFGVEAGVMTQIFGGGSATITALQADRKTLVSRAAELSLGRVRVGDVQRARS